MEDPISNPEAIAEAKRIANAPEAAQLKALLQQQNAKGDLSGARNTINAFLATPEAKELLEQLRKNP